jgi:hypothetical protein
VAAKKRYRETPEKQHARFKEMARQLGADERPEEFERALKKAATVKLPKERKPTRA